METSEKNTSSLSPKDFINKFYGPSTRVLLNEINRAGIGNEKKLFSIYKKIDDGENLSANELFYLTECSEKLDRRRAKGLNKSTSDDTQFWVCPNCGNNTQMKDGRQYCPSCKIYLSI